MTTATSPLDVRTSVLAGRAADALRDISSETEPGRMVSVRIGEQTTAIPAAAIVILVDALDELALGRDVVVAPSGLEIGTSAAARLLGVSRPWVAALVDRGQLEGRRNGTKRRIPLGAALRFARSTRDEIAEAMNARSECLPPTNNAGRVPPPERDSVK
ncbi:MAG: helix-turn-helix domain-containing protein [Acidimicrobiia bacterium]|nr:helix-turn-helix domain-containing protein [Acidimicrobiia bacterium]